jgi:hypothetical protein
VQRLDRHGFPHPVAEPRRTRAAEVVAPKQ